MVDVLKALNFACSQQRRTAAVLRLDADRAEQRDQRGQTRSSSSIEHRRGSEGPRHDPYAFVEYVVRNRMGRVTVHRGLAEWTEVQLASMGFVPVRFEAPRVTIEEQEAIFEIMAGVTLRTAQRTPGRLQASRYRAHRAHGGMECVSGLPGESLTVCRCGAVVECDFDEGAVT